MKADPSRHEAGERCRDVLGVRQGIDLVVVLDVGRHDELARLVEVDDVVVAQLGSVALAASLGRSEQIVEIRPVPRQVGPPSEIAAHDLGVAALVGGHAARRVRGGDGEPGERERVLDVEAIAGPCRVPVALQHRISARQSQVMQWNPRPSLGDHRFVVDPPSEAAPARF